MSKYIGEIMLFTTAIIWGSGFAFSAISLDYFTPYQILAIRFSVGVLILSIIFYNRLKHIKKSTIKRGFILGFLLYLAFLLQTVGLQYTTPSKNAFITAINVVIVPFIAFLWTKGKSINLSCREHFWRLSASASFRCNCPLPTSMWGIF